MLLTSTRAIALLLATLAALVAGAASPRIAEPAGEARFVWAGTMSFEAHLIQHFANDVDGDLLYSGTLNWHLVWSPADKLHPDESESTISGTASRADLVFPNSADCSGPVIPADSSQSMTSGISLTAYDKDEKTMTVGASVPGWRFGNIDACYGGGLRPPVAVEPPSNSYRTTTTHDFSKEAIDDGFVSAPDSFTGSYEYDKILPDGYLYTYKTKFTWSGTIGIGGGDYVAMGDSYGAGVGNEPYDADGCARSQVSYAQIMGLPLRLKHVACSGATVASLTPQFAALSKNTELVTIFVGGNDIGFSGVLSTCIVASLGGAPCWAAQYQGTTVASFVTGQLNRLRRVLPAAYQTIRGRAPNARILVLGYPNFMAPKATERCVDFTIDTPAGPVKLFDAIKHEDVPWLHDRIEELNLVINGAAIDAGVDAEYVDTGREFFRHDLCQPAAKSWFFQLRVGGPKQFTSLHPNGPGQQAIARAISGQAGRLPPRSQDFRLKVGETVSKTVSVRKGVGSVTFSATWTVGRFTLSITAPGGAANGMSLAEPPIEHHKGPGFDSYRVTAPRNGAWRVTIRAVAAPPEGAEVSFRAVTDEPDCVVPRVAGLSVSAAGRELERAHCRLGLQAKQLSRTVPSGSVIRALAPPGAILAPEATVDLLVSSGKRR